MAYFGASLNERIEGECRLRLWGERGEWLGLGRECRDSSRSKDALRMTEGTDNGKSKSKFPSGMTSKSANGGVVEMRVCWAYRNDDGEKCCAGVGRI